MDIAINMLGGFSVTVDGLAIEHAKWRRRQAAALVKVLALAGARSLHREQVIDTLWPDLSVEEAAPRLHKAAHYARRLIGEPGAVVLAGESVALFPQQDIRVDAIEFQKLAEQSIAANDQRTASQAAALYSGELLPHDPYEPWAMDARERLHLRYLDVLRVAGRWDLLTALEPTDEEAHLRLIAELSDKGDTRGALRQFERLERALRRELGVAPSPAATKLRTRLLESDIVVPSPRSPDGSPNPAAPMLFGREDEQARLSGLLDTVQSGSGHVLFIDGPAGIGKTSLTAWLERASAERHMRVGSGVAAHIEGAWPYAPVLEAIADLCRRHPTLLDGLDGSLKAEIESGLSGREVLWTTQSGHQRLFVAVAELLRLAAAGPGAVLVVDDAHQSDDASLRLLHYLARSTHSEPVLLVLSHRLPAGDGLVHMKRGLLGRGTASTLDVKPLSRADVAVLTRRLSPEATDVFVDNVWDASEGVPDVVVDLAREGKAGHTLSAAAWLPSIMTDRQLRACAAVAILGSEFDTDEFLQTTGYPEEEAYAVLDTALTQRLLIRTDTGYAFRDPRFREALLDGRQPPQLRALHRQAAAALESLDRSAGRVGHHLLQGGDPAAAVPWLLKAAESAAALGANQEALATLDRVRPWAEGSHLAQLLSLRAELLMARADASAVDAYREALAVATETGDRSRLRARLARAAIMGGDLETAAIALDGLVIDGSALDADLLFAQGHLALFQGDIAAADAAAAEGRKLAALGRPAEWQAFDLIALQGLLAHNKGQWFQQLRLELRAGAKRPALAARIFDSHLCVAEFLLYGPTPYAEVLELAADLRSTAERSGVLRAVAFASALRGETALLMGNLDLAEAELEEAAHLHHDIGSNAGEAHSLQRLAEVRLAGGDRAEANRLLHRALPLARFTSIARHLLQRLYGTMIAAADGPAAARAMVDHAEAALGVNDHCMFCAIMLAVPAAHACADAGDMAAAERHLRDAENSVGLWEGTAWQASILEVKGHFAVVRGEDADAERLMRSAAELFEAAGQPLDAQRCRR